MEEALNQFFGPISSPQMQEWIYKLFSQDADNSINRIFELLNWLFFAAGLAAALYHLSINIVGSAATGEAEPTKATYIGWLRTTIGLLALPPVFAGYSFLQVAALTIAIAGANLGQVTWTYVVDSFYSDTWISSRQNHAPVHEAALGIIDSQLCYYYTHFEDADYDIPPVKYQTLNGVMQYKSATSGIFNSDHCGRIITPNIGRHYDYADNENIRAAAADYQNEVTAALTRFNDDIAPMMRNITYKLHPEARQLTNDTPIDTFMALNTDALHSYMTRYKNSLDNAYLAMSEVLRAELSELDRSGLESSEWVFAGGYYREIADFNYTISQMAMQAVPEAYPPQWDRIYQDEEDRWNPRAARDLMQQYLRQVLETWEGYKGGFVPIGISPMTSGQEVSVTQEDEARVKTMLRDAMASLLVDYGDEDFRDMHPLAKISDLGFRFEVASITLLGLMGAAAIVGVFISHFSGVFSTFNTIFFVGGGLLSYVFPLIPYLLFSAGLLGWLMAIMIFVILSPIWAIMNINLDNESGMIGKNAAANLVQIVLTPSVMILTLMLSYILFGVASDYIAQGFSNSFSVAEDGTLVYAPIFYSLIFAILHILAAFVCFAPLAVVPDKVMEFVTQSVE